MIVFNSSPNYLKPAKAFKEIGKGIYNKIFVSFEEPFWDTTKVWINFLIKESFNKYPMAKSVLIDGRFLLIFFIYADGSKIIGSMTDEEIKNDLLAFLKTF